MRVTFGGALKLKNVINKTKKKHKNYLYIKKDRCFNPSKSVFFQVKQKFVQ